MVAPVGTPLAGDTVKVPPLQMVAVCAGITGTGLTVIVTVKVDPTHDPAAPDVGVTV